MKDVFPPKVRVIVATVVAVVVLGLVAFGVIDSATGDRIVETTEQVTATDCGDGLPCEPEGSAHVDAGTDCDCGDCEGSAEGSE